MCCWSTWEGRGTAILFPISRFRPRPSPRPVQSQDFHRVCVRQTLSDWACMRVYVLKDFALFVLFAHKMHTRGCFLFFYHSPSFSSDIVVIPSYIYSNTSPPFACCPPSALTHPFPCTSSLGQSTRQKNLKGAVQINLLMYTHMQTKRDHKARTETNDYFNQWLI